MVKLNVELRISAQQSDTFRILASNMRLSHDQLASAMIQTNIEGNESNGFDEIAYHILWAVDDLYPELRKLYRPWLDAAVKLMEADQEAFSARMSVEEAAA